MTTPTTELLTEDEIISLVRTAKPTSLRAWASTIAAARAIERALLARLGEQQPVAWGIFNGGAFSDIGRTQKSAEQFAAYMQAAAPGSPWTVAPLYAAPIPSPAPVGAQSDYVLQLLVTGGHVTQAKVDEARAIAAKVVQAVGAQERHNVDCIGLALALEARAKLVESQTTERAMRAAAHGLRLLAARSAAQGAVQVPAGWALVPVEPTRTMCEAANALPAIQESDLPLRRQGWSLLACQNRTRYREMLAAAPAHAGERQGDSSDA